MPTARASGLAKPSWLAAATPTPADGSRGDSSQRRTPPGKRPPTTPVVSSASRVLPIPPGPVTVTSRQMATSSASASRSASRPTNPDGTPTYSPQWAVANEAVHGGPSA
jgi:hypothetical protein